MNSRMPSLLVSDIAPSSRQVVLFSARELQKMRSVCQLASKLLDHLEPLVRPGVSTQALNNEAKHWMQSHGAVSATLGYAPRGLPPFQGAICTSVNEVVCHGVPSAKQILEDGDIINIDVTPILDGYHGDTSRTFLVGNPSEAVRRLVLVTQEAMMRGIAEVKPGARIGDIGAAIQAYAEANGFSVVRDMVGHGVGRGFHMAPDIPHYGKRGKGLRLRQGMVFTVEPMLNAGTRDLEYLADKWTVITKDRQLSAQFEHTVTVTEQGVEILTQS